MKIGYQNSNFYFQKGFTLLELIVTTAIMVILSTIVFVKFQQMRGQQSIQSQAIDIISKIREIQTNAQSGKAIPGTGEFPKAYQIAFSTGGTGYRVDYITNTATTTLTTINFYGNLKINQVYLNGTPASQVILRADAPFAVLTVDGLRNQIVTIELKDNPTGFIRKLVIDGISGRIGLQ